MRLIDADELMEHAMRDKLDSRELIWQMIENAPTIPYDMKWNPECKDCLPKDINDCIRCKQR